MLLDDNTSAHAFRDLLPLATYDRLRTRLRPWAISYKRRRTVPLGPFMWLQFEDVVTLRYQLQEVMRIERVLDASALHDDVTRYAGLLPDGASLRATLLIEIDDARMRLRELPALNEAVHHIYFEVAGTAPCVAHVNDDLVDRHRGRLSAVHFMRFALSDHARSALRQGAGAWLGCSHPQHELRRPVPPLVLALLASDLAPSSASGARALRATGPQHAGDDHYERYRERAP